MRDGIIRVAQVNSTKQKLSQAYLRLLASQPDNAKLSVRKLCLEAGVNQTTFYRHYKNSVDFVHQVWHGYNEFLFENVIIDGRIKLPQWFQFVEQHHAEAKDLIRNQEFIKLLIRDLFQAMNQDESNKIEFQLYSVALVSVTKYWIEQGFKYTGIYMNNVFNEMYGSNDSDHPVNQFFDFEL